MHPEMKKFDDNAIIALASGVRISNNLERLTLLKNDTITYKGVNILAYSIYLNKQI